MPSPTSIYIAGAACISPQTTLGGGFLENPPPPPDAPPRLRCVEPDYRQWLDPRLLRRMSRVVKMGAAAALAALRQAGVAMPDAIATGTAYGCVEDTETFLRQLVVQNEEMLAPTAFIQSTHNTIGAQIALLLQCRAHNSTFVHRAFSFEHALTDALLLLREGEARTALAGGVDEMTDSLFQILTRFGLFRNNRAAAGESASYFLLSSERTDAALARLLGVATFYKPENFAENVRAFLSEHGLDATGPDLVLLGLDLTALEALSGLQRAGFKHLCGEHPVASAFATWLAIQILSGKKLPETWLPPLERPPRNVLVCNHFFNIHHSLILLGRMLTYRRTDWLFAALLAAAAVLDAWRGVSWAWYALLVLLYSAALFYGCCFIQSGFFLTAACRGEPSGRGVALTFDDGPSAEHTPQVLAILREHGVKAAFFIIGKNIAGNEDLLRSIVREGHVLGNHSFSHDFWFDLFSEEKMLADLRRCDAAIESATGRRPLLFRPPYGVVNPRLRNAVRRGGWQVAGWSLRSFDTVADDKQKLMRRLTGRLKAGGVVLFHDHGKKTLEVLPEFIRAARQMGFTFEPPDQLLKLQPYA